MSAGLTSHKKLKANPSIYQTLEARAKRLMNGLEDIANDANIDLVTTVRGSMFGFFFSSKSVNNFEDALKNNSDLFAKFHQGMLNSGVYLACSAYETGFISTATTDDMIEETLRVAKIVMNDIK